MNTLPNATKPEVQAHELELFRSALETLCRTNLAEMGGALASQRFLRIELECGPKFVRVVRAEYLRKFDAAGQPLVGEPLSRSAHCFVDRTNGDILKPAGWKGPEKKNPRGNIFAADPLAGVTVYGVVYLNR